GYNLVFAVTIGNRCARMVRTDFSTLAVTVRYDDGRLAELPIAVGGHELRLAAIDAYDVATERLEFDTWTGSSPRPTVARACIDVRRLVVEAQASAPVWLCSGPDALANARRATEVP